MSYLSTQTDIRGVTTITFDRPDAANAMNRAFIDEFTITLGKLRSNTRILVIAANGKHFCAGADIHWMKQSAKLSYDENHADAMSLSTLLKTLDTFSCPTIAKVRGAALGGGTGIVTNDFSNGEYGNDVTQQSDGKLLVSGFVHNGMNLDFDKLVVAECAVGLFNHARRDTAVTDNDDGLEMVRESAQTFAGS